ncbi:MAG: nucleotide-diphospho-sugar transferase, partial [Armatimonadetes bacterium]|nr:nucleotide-diphospho-sugar transferase [Armatimonadota bacterium]
MEGNFTGGNMVLLHPRFLQQNRDRIAQAYGARKSPLRLGMMIGFKTVVRFLLSQLVSPNLLSVAMLEGEISRLIGGRARALICKRPEIATDVDRPADLLVAQSLLVGTKEP